MGSFLFVEHRSYNNELFRARRNDPQLDQQQVRQLVAGPQPHWRLF